MPESIGKYEVRGTLGRGAMGVVYDGWDAGIGRRVAIKTLRLADADADAEVAEGLIRFRQEAQAVGRLSHVNIVGVFDTGETAGVVYMVMEFIEGRSLKEILDAEKSLPPARAAEIMEQVLAGLDYTHKRGVVHRDIKPANVMLTEDGQVKLADFGIARIASSDATAVGVIMGTPAYMPAEQFMGEPADARSDIYAAGAMLFHLLTGSRPYEGNPTSIMTRVVTAVAAPVPSERSVSVAPAWDAVIARAMARQPEDRFQSAAEFAAAVRRAVAAPIVPAEEEADATMVVGVRGPLVEGSPALAAVEPPTAGALGEVARGRRGLVVAGGAVTAVAAAVLAGWFLLTPRRAPVAFAPVSHPHVAAIAVSRPNVAGAPARTPASGETMAKLASASAGVPCSLVAVARSGTGLVMTGVAGAALPLAALRRAVTDTPGPVNFAVQEFPAAFCPAVDVLRPIIQHEPAAFTIPEAVQPIRSMEHMHPTIGPAAFESWVQVYYLSGDGTVSNVLPMPAYKARPYNHPADPSVMLAMGGSLRLGERPHNVLVPGTPFGTDMMIAILSSARLFDGPRREGESVQSFAAALQRALDAARASGVRVAAAVTLVSTVK